MNRPLNNAEFDLQSLEPISYFGFVRRISQGLIEATGPLASIGDVCRIDDPDGDILAEVASVRDHHIALIPFDPTRFPKPDAKVRLATLEGLAPVGDAFSGRIVDAFGMPLDSGPAIPATTRLALAGDVVPPLDREDASEILSTGIRAIDGLMPIGRGQRVGIFAASGVGKTTLITQLAAQTSYDRCVLCLVGERGREVDLIWSELSKKDASKLTCVAATSDLSPVLRVRAVSQALCLAEYWRGQGEDVLLVVDSVTRLALALREIGLAAGEPPTARGMTPNVFAALPRVVERCGAQKKKGAITAFFTVLTETDDGDDPVAEALRSLLDGHIILSRTLAEQGQFPAIDPIRSISRQSDRLTSDTHLKAAREVLAALSTYDEARMMIESGIYKDGGNAAIDNAIAIRPSVLEFLGQGQNEAASLAATVEQLTALPRKAVVHA